MLLLQSNVQIREPGVIGMYDISVKTVFLVLFEGFIGILTFVVFFPSVDMSRFTLEDI